MNLCELGELCGIHSGDGYLRNDGKRREIDISGSFEERIYYDNYVIPLVNRLFKIKIKGKFFHSRKTYGFVIRDKKIIENFQKLGFSYGRKLTIRVPKFIMNSNKNEIKCSFLRGILDTDGCINFDRRCQRGYSEFKRKHHTYPRILITTTFKDFCLDIEKILNQVGINFWVQKHETKNDNEKTKYIIWVRGKNFLKWMEKIGSRNPVKYSRYEIWKKHGFCPPKTTFKERLQILKEEVNPKSLYGPVA